MPLGVCESTDAQRARVDGGTSTFASPYRFRWTRGGDLSKLAGAGAIVRAPWAEDHGLSVGSPLRIVTPAGKRVRLTVAALYDPAKLDNLLGHVLISQRTFDASFETPGDAYTFVRSVGSRLGARADVEVPHVPDARLLDRAVEVRGESSRASGPKSRRCDQPSLIGAALGIPLGLGLAAAVTHALARYGVAFSLPLTSIAVFTAIAIGAGTLAAILPARRAGRLNVLAALQYE